MKSDQDGDDSRDLQENIAANRTQEESLNESMSLFGEK